MPTALPQGHKVRKSAVSAAAASEPQTTTACPPVPGPVPPTAATPSPTMPSGNIVDRSVVGDGNSKGVLSEKHTIQTVFTDFATMRNKRGESTFSSVMSCHGYKWQVEVYPRGDKKSDKNIAHVSVFLWCVSVDLHDVEVKAKYALRVPTAGAVAGASTQLRKECCVFAKGKSGGGSSDYAALGDVLNPCKGFLVDGNLTIDADIQIYLDKLPAWTPKTTLQLDYLKILESGDGADVTFQVGDTEFPAHRHILQARAPGLAALAKDCSSETLIPIHNFTPSVFRALLRVVYADDVPEPEKLRVEARELLDVADFCDCKVLKLMAESELAASGITVDTAADLILLGDAKKCALLKEAAIDFFATNPKAVKASPGWARVKESSSVLAELVDILVDGKRWALTDGNGRNYKRMCVSDLRRKLDEKGLDVDGSREMLVESLEKGDEKGIVVDGFESIEEGEIFGGSQDFSLPPVAASSTTLPLGRRGGFARFSRSNR